MQVEAGTDFRFQYLAKPLLLDQRDISFSVEEIRQLANQFGYPEGFLNYLQRFRLDQEIQILAAAGNYPSGSILLRMYASEIANCLLAEHLIQWATSNCVSEDPLVQIQFHWLLDYQHRSALHFLLDPDMKIIRSTPDISSPGTPVFVPVSDKLKASFPFLGIERWEWHQNL